MEDTGNSFFHMLCGAVLFISAILCMVVGIHGVNASVTISKAHLSDKVAYETLNPPEEMLIKGEDVIAYLLAEPQHAVCIKGKDLEVMISRGDNPVQAIVSAGTKRESLFRVDYVYGIYGDIRQVCFTKVEE